MRKHTNFNDEIFSYDEYKPDRFFDPLDTVAAWVIGGLVLAGIALAVLLV